MVMGCFVTKSVGSCELEFPAAVLTSHYQRRVQVLAGETVSSPAVDSLDGTLRKCIAFCYGVTAEWAPHVRVTVYADNPAEHQSNVPVYSTLLTTWGVEGFNERVECRAVQGTDVKDGVVHTSSFWSRTITVAGTPVVYRDLIHYVLHWFTELPNDDARKQLLVNMILQLHEACYNCIGRHKEVFEYCIYDLIDAETGKADALAHAVPPTFADAVVMPLLVSQEIQGAQHVVRRFVARFLDRHKRDALQAAMLSPIKFLFQDCYEVFENIDSHGSSFWASVLQTFFPELEMPFESIVGLDNGWVWAAVDFLTIHGDADEALRIFSEEENIGLDWRTLSKGLVPPGHPPRLPYLQRDHSKFLWTLADPKGSPRRSLEPYVKRFTQLMSVPLLLRRCGLAIVSSSTWDVAEGPALAALSPLSVESQLTPALVRATLCSCEDAASVQIDSDMLSKFLRAAGLDFS